jgi:hypothetical protein
MAIATAAIAILGPILIKAGAPLLKRVLEQELGNTAGEIGSVVIDSIAGKLGVEPTAEAIVQRHAEAPVTAEMAIREVEASADWINYLAQATAARDRLLEREDQRESFFSWGWRPAMSWLVIFLFGWALVMVPLANAVFGSSIAPPPVDSILQFAGIWLVVYGGGHTAKSLWGRK